MMLEEFISYLRIEKNRPETTASSYRFALVEFQTFYTSLDETLTWQTVDADVVRDWAVSLMDKGNSPSTVSQRLSALRTFYKWALRRQYVDADPTRMIKGVKRSKSVPHFIREKDMDMLLDPKMWTDSYEDSLARTILIILYEAGLRVSELVGLDDVDVNMTNREIKVTGKRDKQRIIPFGDELRDALAAYRAQRDEEISKASAALLLNAKGERVKVAWVQRMVKQQLGRVTTQQKRSPHVLRHTFATSMLNHEAGLESVRKLLGHESVATTEIYTHTTFEQLKRVYMNAHPRA